MTVVICSNCVGATVFHTPGFLVWICNEMRSFSLHGIQEMNGCHGKKWKPWQPRCQDTYSRWWALMAITGNSAVTTNKEQNNYRNNKRTKTLWIRKEVQTISAANNSVSRCQVLLCAVTNENMSRNDNNFCSALLRCSLVSSSRYLRLDIKTSIVLVFCHAPSANSACPLHTRTNSKPVAELFCRGILCALMKTEDKQVLNFA